MMLAAVMIATNLIGASNAFSATGLRRFAGEVSHQKRNPVAWLQMRKVPSESDDSFANMIKKSKEVNASAVDFHLAESREEIDLSLSFAKDGDREMVESCLIRDALYHDEMAAGALNGDNFANMSQEIKKVAMDLVRTFAKDSDREMMESSLRDGAEIAGAFASLGSSTSKSALPRSVNFDYYSDEDTPFWHPSAQIDKEGFLVKNYVRIPSELEIGQDAIEGKHRKSKLAGVPVRIRQVPGDGDCLFHSVTICLSKTENGTHFCYDNIAELKRSSRLLREQTVDFLASNERSLYFQGDDYVRADEFIEVAASPYGCTAEEYCAAMRQESVWGGGPEVVALCNLLKRPIHMYDLYPYKKRDFKLRRMVVLRSLIARKPCIFYLRTRGSRM